MSLARTVAVLSQQVDEALQEQVGISATDKVVLTELAMSEGPLRMVDVAGRLLVTRAGVTRMVDRLEGMGLVRRQASEEDRRVTHIVITDQGRSRWNEARKVFYACLRERLFAHLEEEEMTAIREALDRVLGANDTPAASVMPPR